MEQSVMENLVRIDIKSPDVLTDDILEICVTRLKSKLNDKAASGKGINYYLRIKHLWLNGKSKGKN